MATLAQAMRVANQIPSGGPDVLAQFVEPAPPARFVEPLARRGQVAELSARLPRRVGRAHAVGDQPIDFEREVGAHLFGEVSGGTSAPGQYRLCHV
jgi:hypothetical protein